MLSEAGAGRGEEGQARGRRAPGLYPRQAQPWPSQPGRSARLLRNRRCGSAGARAGPRAPVARPPGPRKTGAGPASRLGPVPSCPRPPLQPLPVAPRSAPRGPAGPGCALAPSAPSGMALGRVAPGPWRHGCSLWLLVGAVRGGVWGLHTMPRECCSLHIRRFLEVLELP